MKTGRVEGARPCHRSTFSTTDLWEDIGRSIKDKGITEGSTREKAMQSLSRCCPHQDCSENKIVEG
jgi:hypothetical protein